MKLYLDDVRGLPDDSWTLARTAEEAKELLATGLVEYASLDHDLGECDECSKSFPARAYAIVTQTCHHRMTGYDLVKWMALNDHWPKNKPSVHSANIVGKANMLAFIERYFHKTPAE